MKQVSIGLVSKNAFKCFNGIKCEKSQVRTGRLEVDNEPIFGFLYHLQKDTLKNFKCGADFLPSPLASKPQFALKADALLTRPGLLTAVAVAVENDHTVAFLGNDQGVVLKVQLFSCLPVFALQLFCYMNT